MRGMQKMMDAVEGCGSCSPLPHFIVLSAIPVHRGGKGGKKAIAKIRSYTLRISIMEAQLHPAMNR